ncbi:MAG: DUF4166 domain-containing protein [Pseudomonadota bacterium]
MELPLAYILDATKDPQRSLAITAYQAETPTRYLFESALGERWDALEPAAKALHQTDDVTHFTGQASVERGKGWMARLIARVIGFPKAGDTVSLMVTKARKGAAERWVRRFGHDAFSSDLMPAPKPFHVRERFGAFTFEQSLPVEDGMMELKVERGWFLGVPMPRWMLPTSRAREFVRDGRFHFDVALETPLRWLPGSGLIVRYRGSLAPAQPDQASKARAP